MDNSGHWLPNQDLLWQCGQIFLAEVAIDVAKHAVVGKFNEIRPGVYREFMKVSIVPTHPNASNLFYMASAPLDLRTQVCCCHCMKLCQAFIVHSELCTYQASVSQCLRQPVSKDVQALHIVVNPI